MDVIVNYKRTSLQCCRSHQHFGNFSVQALTFSTTVKRFVLHATVYYPCTFPIRPIDPIISRPPWLKLVKDKLGLSGAAHMTDCQNTE